MKQEHKQQILEGEPNPFELPKALPDDVFYESLEEPKQETLEESAENYENKDQHQRSKLDFIEGAKWMKERMYSEEEVLQLLLRLQQTESYDNLYDWFEQFKKK